MKQVVELLEEDTVFKKKLEESNISEIKVVFGDVYVYLHAQKPKTIPFHHAPFNLGFGFDSFQFDHVIILLILLIFVFVFI